MLWDCLLQHCERATQSKQGEAEIEREPVGPQNSSEVNRALQESTDSVSMDKSSRTLQEVCGCVENSRTLISISYQLLSEGRT